jgi:tRNA A-37 threonylcarbamoyl transferase component Bud32
MEQSAARLVSDQAFEFPSEPLAAGGMAVVFQARDRRLPRDVILKCPRTHAVDGSALEPAMRGEFEHRLETEALILARLQHPAIVTIHELGRGESGAPFCVLQRVEGLSLRDILLGLEEQEQGLGKPATRERLELVSSLQSIAEALACAHDLGVVHRDVTPNNIIIGPRGEATLIDWGLAKDLNVDASGGGGTDIRDRAMPLDQETGDGSATIIAGTPPYVCLEQALGKPAHPSYDVYSFGATLYHVVAGRAPFGDDSAVSYLARLVNGERPDPAVPQDPELSGIIDRAMATNVDDRFTAAELLRALKEYLTGDLVFSHRYSLTGRLGRWVRKRRAAAIAILAVVFALVTAAVAWSQVSQRAERSARRAAEGRSRAAARIAAAETKAAEEARRAFAAERERSEALATVALKDLEAQQAQEEADRAGKNSKTYRQLKLVADRKRKEADQARAAANNQAEAAEKRAAEARAAAERARTDAAETRREATQTMNEASRIKDQALAERREAELERDQALVDRKRAEQERDQALADRQRAQAERDQALADRARAEQERDQLRERVRQLEEARRGSGRPDPTPSPEPAPAEQLE